MTLASFLSKLKNTPEGITFPETIAVIEENYNFTPTTFQNGNQHKQLGKIPVLVNCLLSPNCKTYQKTKH